MVCNTRIPDSKSVFDSGQASLFDARTKAQGPAGSLPFTPEMLRTAPSGNLFGWTMNAGMGWDPAKLGGTEVLILSTHGGLRAPDGTPIALGFHSGHWEVGLLVEAAARELASLDAVPFAAACSDPCDGRSQGTTGMFDSLPYRNDASTVFRRLIRSLPTRGAVLGVATCDKGLPELMEAFDAILKAEPAAHLLLVGWFDAAEDALCANLRTRIENHPRIHCTGFVADTAPYYRAMDVMVLPTWREGFPNAVLEAAATGIPVVTTIATGSRDSVVPEVTGLLIPPGYPEAISEAVLKLLSDPAKRQHMGVAARAWVVEHYSNDRVLGLITTFYRSLLEPSTRRNLAGPTTALVPAAH